MKTKPLFVLAAMLCYATAWATPTLSNVNFQTSVGKYQKFEINFDLNAYLNPYDTDEIDVWAEFTAPSGKQYKVYAFYYEGWTKLDDGAYTSDEILAPAGTQGWKIRFSPTEEGNWTFRMRARDIAGTATEPATGISAFTVTHTGDRGFISKANSRFLKYDSGEPYIPIGDSYPWWLVSPWRANVNGTEKGTNIAKHYMDDMSANGVTYNRFEINFFEGLNLIGRDYVLQKTFHNYYNQRDAWQMDEIIEHAKYRGISLNVPIFASVTLIDNGGFRYLGPDDPDGQPDIIPARNSAGDTMPGNAFGNWSVFNPYNHYQDVRYLPELPDSVGDCKNICDFFQEPSALIEQQKLMRYVVARWGYCTNLMSWELVDEINSDFEGKISDLNPHFIEQPKDWTQTVANWHETMYDFIKSVDPYQHLISSPAIDDSLFALVAAKMDFIDVHWYTDYGYRGTYQVGSPFEYGLADAVDRWQKKYNKPVAIMEIGWFAENRCQDPKRYELHNLIWSALFNGSMGLTAIWAHEVEVLGGGALNQFAGVSQYSKLLPPLSEIHANKRFQRAGLKWEFLQDNVHDEIYGRVQDENFTYFSLWNGLYYPYVSSWNPADRPPLSSDRYATNFKVDRPGTYRVSWYNTETGLLHSSDQVVTYKDSLTVTMPRELRLGTWADAGFTVKFVTGAPTILAYPNPSDGVFQVVIKQEAAPQCKYEVYSALGALILREEVALDPEEMTFAVDLGQEARGMYFLRVSVDGETYLQRLLRQ